ncbi:hypothetical protein GCM10027343_25670 [Noviherbaspirillum agri]
MVDGTLQVPYSAAQRCHVTLVGVVVAGAGSGVVTVEVVVVAYSQILFAPG